MYALVELAVVLGLLAGLVWAERKYGATALLAVLALAAGAILLLIASDEASGYEPKPAWQYGISGTIFICTSFLLGGMVRPILVLTKILEAQNPPLNPEPKPSTVEKLARGAGSMIGSTAGKVQQHRQAKQAKKAVAELREITADLRDSAAIYCPKCEKPSPAESKSCTACGYALA